jgi:3'-5' exoribonuclease
MSKPKPTLVRLGDLTPGQSADFYALLSERTRSLTRDQKVYYACRFRDARRTVAAMIWADSKWFDECDEDWQAGQFFKIRGTFIEHEKYGPQIEIELIRHVKEGDEGFDPADFVERSRHDSAVMFAELKELVTQQIADEPLRRLVLALLDGHAERWQRLPATRERYYPFMGGLLEHTLAMTRTCLLLVERYRAYYTELKPPLNKDLVVAGGVLHDLGRVVEFDAEPLAPNLSVPGRLTGHLILGRDLVRDKARELGDVNPDLLQLLDHVLLSYAALPEWGSPRLPLVPESLILHHVWDLDAKLEMYVRCLSRDQAAGPFTERDPGLSRQLFKGRMV